MCTEYISIIQSKIKRAVDGAGHSGIAVNSLTVQLNDEGFDRADVAEALLGLECMKGTAGILFDTQGCLRTLREGEAPRDEYGILAQPFTPALHETQARTPPSARTSICSHP